MEESITCPTLEQYDFWYDRCFHCHYSRKTRRSRKTAPSWCLSVWRGRTRWGRTRSTASRTSLSGRTRRSSGSRSLCRLDCHHVFHLFNFATHSWPQFSGMAVTFVCLLTESFQIAITNKVDSGLADLEERLVSLHFPFTEHRTLYTTNNTLKTTRCTLHTKHWTLDTTHWTPGLQKIWNWLGTDQKWLPYAVSRIIKKAI